ncbi:hypothetical protein QN084_06275 [Paenarthrobacter sp. R1]|uniref:hypothetical protein n=1 Tax=Paenarthrobacter sp. R1 TaxID=3049085 RepID=UPI002553571D|nr:hypothetical protein [Paenarthrobacter sp. R1]WIV32214.1 hypothetical protein QN084_06275 [Paenarthrobacter sp. R1]
MNNETNRLAQLIATAADKELGTRPDGQPRRQDKAAAMAIETEYLFIRRADLPTVGNCGCSSEGIEINGDCWAGDDDHPRETALEHLAVWQYREAEKAAAAQEAEMELNRRRDTLAEKFRGEGIPYEDVSPPLKLAIDHIIEIEGKAA